VRHKYQLQREFASAAKKGKSAGRLHVDDWSRIVSDVLKLDLDTVVKYQPWLTDVVGEPAVEVDAHAFIQRFEVRLQEQYIGWQRTVLQMFYNSLLAADLQINELLGFFDRDSDGQVSLSECIEAISSLELGLSAQQVAQLTQTLGFEQPKSGKGGKSQRQASPKAGSPSKLGSPKAAEEESQIDLETFLKRLALVADHTVIPRHDQESMDLKTIAGWIDDLAKSSGKTLSALFQQWDENGDGYIDYEEFVVCCMTTQNKVSNSGNLDYEFTREEFDELARTVDQAKTGRINYLSFLGLFPELANSAPRAPYHHSGPDDMVCFTIWMHEALLTKALKKSDPQGVGSVTPAQFQRALDQLNAAVSEPYKPIAPAELEKLCHSLPLDNDAKVNYHEFLDAFGVYDKVQEAHIS